jgi:hypothetical protein
MIHFSNHVIYNKEIAIILFTDGSRKKCERRYTCEKDESSGHFKI